ncbi:MAG: PAS domain S-box protein [Alphaproteobacteria bacterium]|nr:PAS domain S-box protein [Alphaproteobacteria bacterium]
MALPWILTTITLIATVSMLLVLLSVGNTPQTEFYLSLALIISAIVWGFGRFITHKKNTQSKQKLEEIQNSEKRFRDILEVASDWFWEMDEELRFTYISGQLFDRMNISPEDVLNRSPVEIKGFEPGRRGRKSWKNYQRILWAQKPFYDIEFRLFAGTDDEQYVRISGKPLFNADGVFKGYRGAATEITAQIRAEELLKGAHDALEVRVQERTLELQVEIAERKRAEEALLSSEQRFRDVAEASSDWIWETDEKFCFIGISERFQDIVGYNVETLNGKSVNGLGLNLIDSNKEKQIRKLLDQRKPFRDFTFTIRDVEEKQRYIKISGKPVIESDGSFRGYRGMAADISEQMKTENTLKKLSRTVEQSPAIIVITDPDGLIEYVNPRFTMVTGYELPEVVGQSPEIFQAQEINKKFYEEIWQRVTQGNEWHGEFHNRKKDGETYWAAASISPVKSDDGAISNFIYTAEDITERKESEAQIRFQASLLEQVRNAVIATDLDGRIAYWNKFAEVVFLREGAKVLGQKFDEVLKISHNVDQSITSGWGKVGDDYYEGELMTVRGDGTSFPAFMTSSKITDSQGGELGFVRVVLDLTERKKVEDQLVQASKLATLGEMAAGMTHELNQPINIIRMTSDASIMDFDDGIATLDGQKEKFITISDQTQRMAEIIDHMKVLSRKDDMEQEVFDPYDAVQAVTDMVGRQFRSEGVDIDAIIPVRRYPVRGRKVQLEQVILNLMTNARDAILTSGSKNPLGAGGIKGRINVHCGYSRKTDQLRLIVGDTGGGIPQEAIGKIFEPFFTTKEAGRGTGLGLSVSMSIIDRMGASIDVKNKKEGAEFTIKMPVDREVKRWRIALEETDIDNDDLGDVDAGKWHLLIVDDETMAAEILGSFFSQKGYRVTLAHDGVEAYEMYLEDPADLVITDIRMPHRDGNELMKYLHERTPDLPIIIATGQLEADDFKLSSDEISEEEIDRGHKGASAIFRKPLELSELAETVRLLLS